MIFFCSWFCSLAVCFSVFIKLDTINSTSHPHSINYRRNAPPSLHVINLLFCSSELASELESFFPSLSDACAEMWGGCPSDSILRESGFRSGAGMQEAGANKKKGRPKLTSTSPSLSTFSTRPVFPIVCSHSGSGNDQATLEARVNS